jgi:hypothetical protein
MRMKRALQTLVRWSLLGSVALRLAVTAAAQPNIAFVVYPEFENVLADSQGNPTDQNSLAIFGGSVGLYSPPGAADAPVIPESAEGIQLADCSFGETLARLVPYANFEVETIQSAQAILYPPASANTRELIAGSGTAFRYRQLLYTSDGTGVRAEFETITDYFGDTERQRARDGIDVLRQAIKYSPLNRSLRHALLDGYYDFILAEAQHVKNDLAQVAKYRLGLVALPPGEFIIDREISGYEGIVRKYESILDEYGKLFVDRGGVDVSRIDGNAPPGIILGQWIFQQEQPQRSQLAAQYRDASGNLATVPLLGSTTPMLFAGYKDYVALLGVMRDYAQSAAELAKLYGMRGRAAQPGQKDDRTLGFELIDGVNTEILLNTGLLNALLPNAFAPSAELDTSGAREALAGVLTSTAELTKVGGFLNSQVNVLGFDPDFLALISTFVDQDQQHLWDSYDALRGWLDAGGPASILQRARDAYALAVSSYDSYRGYADQLFNEFDSIESAYAARYREITGYSPGEPSNPYPSPIPAGRYPPINLNVAPTHVNNPRPGSELRQVYQSIEQSNARYSTLATSATLLDHQVDLAHDRLLSSSNRTDAINAATKNYKGTIAIERDTITHWSAKQAGAQAAYDMVSDIASMAAGIAGNPISGWGAAAAIGSVAAAGIANMAIQIKGEQKKGDAQKNLDLAAADFEKNLALADTDQNVFQAGEEQRNLEREKQSQLLTMQDNAFVRDQDLERVDGLLRELQQVDVLRQQNNSALAGRYYADPIHYLRAQNNMIRADFAFKSAQRWVFFALRALEYKYNQPFVYTEPTPGSPRWEFTSLFRIRNAQELEDLLAAMTQFNLANLGKLNGRSTVTERISMKDDVWGRTLLDPQDRSGEFQRRIASSYDTQRGVYEIKLNTLRLSKELANGNLFRGAEYGLDSSLVTPGFYLDKIEWVKVKFVDTREPNPVSQVGDLSYGGTSFVRPECADPLDPGIENSGELQGLPFRSFSMGTDANGVLRAVSSAEQRASISVAFWNQMDKALEPNADFEAAFLRERSVAISDLTLTIAGDKVNPAALEDVHIYIRHRYANRTVCQP